MNLVVLFKSDLLYFIIYVGGAIILTLLLIGLSIYFQRHLSQPSAEKISTYECGFQPFTQTSHIPFNVQYYLISLLFILFDIEIVFLIPLVYLLLTQPTLTTILTIFLFNLILWIGFWCEWYTNILDLSY